MTDEQHNHSDSGHAAEDGDGGHEPNAFSVRTAAYAIVGIGILCVLTFGFMFAIYRGLSKPVERRDAAEQQPEFVRARQQQVEPSLSLGGSAALNQLQQAARQRLESYAWIDEEAGIARVPISRGMEIVIKEGFPTRTEQGVGSNGQDIPTQQAEKTQPGNGS